MDDAVAPLLLFVVGPPAVGKMSVGQAIAERTGLRLFHNHISIELALRYFEYGTPAFSRISGGIRRLILEEVAASDLPGLIFTFVWAFDVAEDEALLDEYAAPFRSRGGRALFVELEATQSERLRRNAGESRLAEKASKRDLEASRRRLLANDARYQLNSGGKFDQRADYLRIDNTTLTPGEVAERVIAHFELAGAPGFLLLFGCCRLGRQRRSTAGRLAVTRPILQGSLCRCARHAGLLAVIREGTLGGDYCATFNYVFRMFCRTMICAAGAGARRPRGGGAPVAGGVWGC
jgi:hypothetical protein